MAVIFQGDWIMAGAGRTIIGPLQSRGFLVRLHDVNRSLALYHDNHISATAVANDSDAAINLSKAIVGSPTELSIHTARNAEIQLGGLLEIPPSKRPFREHPPILIDGLRITLRRRKLAMSAAWACSFRAEATLEDHAIAGTSFVIRTSAALKQLWTKSLETGYMDLLEVVITGPDGTEYGLHSDESWEVTAIDPDAPRKDAEVTLTKPN